MRGDFCNRCLVVSGAVEWRGKGNKRLRSFGMPKAYKDGMP